MPTQEELREAIEWGRRQVIEAAKDFGPPVTWTDAEVEAHERSMAAAMIFDNEFAFTIDVKTCEYSFRQGISRALGWSDDITMTEFMSLMHPDYFVMFQRWAGASYMAVQRFKDSIRPMAQSYRIMFPLRNSKGQWMQVAQASFVLQVDAKGNMLKYFNRYWVSHRAWNEVPLRPDIFDGADVSELWTERMNHEIAKGISGHLFLGVEEKVLWRYHDKAVEKNRAEAPGSPGWKPPVLADVAATMNTNVENVRKHRMNILRKADLFMERHFAGLDDLYIELCRLGLFDSPRPQGA